MSEQNNNSVFVEQMQLDRQKEYTARVRGLLSERFSSKRPMALVHTYGCQGNVSDSEKIKGMLFEMGYDFTENADEAELILYNTCAIREHAEDRVFGNVGALKHYKRRNPNLKIVLCGCMMQQQKVAQRIQKSFPYVDLVFGTHVVHQLPELLYRTLSKSERVFSLPESDGCIAEGLPVYRDGSVRAFISIMYGCNNFCSYCIVPYVRGRERSREPEAILAEARELIKAGYKDITLLGQNVNSYGKNLPQKINFSDLLRQINAIEGDFRIRFMTSHPKDCTHELLDAMAQCEKVCRHLHLPFQSGSNRVLKAMNRGYTREQYLSLLSYAREVMPDISFTSDIIVGFPGETYDEFKETLDVVKQGRFTNLYTFIFSPRDGTPAAEMDDPFTYEEKVKRFQELLALQETMSAEYTGALVGKTQRVLVEEAAEQAGCLSARTSGNVLVTFPGDEALIGSFCDVKITESKTWIMRGEKI